MRTTQTARGRRRAGPRVAAALGVLAAAVTAAGCSVPREADLAAAGSRSASSPSPSVPVVPSPVAVTVEPSPTPTPTRAPSPTPSPPLLPVKAPVPAAVKGYTLAAPGRSVPDPLGKVQGARDVFGATTARSVTKGSDPVGLLFLFAVRPQYLDDQRVIKIVVDRLTTSISKGGVPLTAQKVGTQRVSAGSSAKNGTIVVWYSGGVLAVVVGGGDPALVTGYAKALIAAS